MLDNIPQRKDIITLHGREWLVLRVEEYEYNGAIRHSITCRKLKGRKPFNVVRYENGQFSSMVTY